MIVDSHVHICEPPHDNSRLLRKNIDGSRVQWSDTRADAAVDRLIEAMDGNGIDGALIMGLEGVVPNEYLGRWSPPIRGLRASPGWRIRRGLRRWGSWRRRCWITVSRG